MDTAACGEEGIDFARHFDYDAIILDLNLPDMSGFEVLRLLRRAQIDTPVIVLSGSATVDSKVKALNTGADDYMTKPFSNEELVGRLRALVRRSKGYSDSRISFGPMTLDLVAKRRIRGGGGGGSNSAARDLRSWSCYRCAAGLRSAKRP